MALIIGIVISIPIGVYAAIRQDTIPDYILRSIAILLISVPSFWIGTMIMIYPSIWWGWSPPMELIPFTKDPLGNLGMFIIPALVLGTGLTGSSYENDTDNDARSIASRLYTNCLGKRTHRTGHRHQTCLEKCSYPGSHYHRYANTHDHWRFSDYRADICSSRDWAV